MQTGDLFFLPVHNGIISSQKVAERFLPDETTVLSTRVLFFQGSILFFQLLVQPLHCRERHTSRIDITNVFVIHAQTEGRREILHYRADLPHADVVRIIPALNRHRGDFVQNLGIDQIKVAIGKGLSREDNWSHSF